MNADGTGVKALNTAPQEDAFPSWSPDGKRIVFRRHFSTNQLWIMNADGTGAFRLTSNMQDYAESPAWSPDGHTIAFKNGHNAIALINDDGTNQRELSNANAAFPAWSPDGKTLAFQLYPPQYPQDRISIYIMNADGTGMRRLTSSPDGDDWTPAWSRDGQRILFARQVYTMDAQHVSTTEWSLFSVKVDGGDLQKIRTVGAFRPTW
jgi:TolB protein